jgi:hypothetical protein
MERVPPNLKQKDINSISHLLDSSSVSFIDEDYQSSFNKLMMIKLRVANKLNQDDLKNLKFLELKIISLKTKKKTFKLDMHDNSQNVNRAIDIKMCPLVQDYMVQIRNCIDKVFPERGNENNGY